MEESAYLLSPLSLSLSTLRGVARELLVESAIEQLTKAALPLAAGLVAFQADLAMPGDQERLTRVLHKCSAGCLMQVQYSAEHVAAAAAHGPSGNRMFNRCNPMVVPWTSVTSNSAFRFSTRQIRMRKLL